MIEDTNKIIRAYLVTQTILTNLVGGASPRIYCPRLPENATLPAVSFLVRGGGSNVYIKPIVSPSVQFDCWADNLMDAREVYRALYDVLQGQQMVNVVVGGNTFTIMSAREEVQGQDLQDVDIPNYFRVLTFFAVMIRADS